MRRVTIRPGFPGHVLFFWLLSGRGFENRRFVRVFDPIRKYIRTLPIAKAYDGMRQRKLVSFQYKMSVKGKVFPYSLSSVGPGADPGVQAVSPQVT